MRKYLPFAAIAVCLAAATVDAQTLTVSRDQWNKLVGTVQALQTEVVKLNARVTTLEKGSSTSALTARVATLEKQAEAHRAVVNTALAYLREDQCRYAEAINLLSTRPSQLSPEPLKQGCPDKSKLARSIPADITK